MGKAWMWWYTMNGMGRMSMEWEKKEKLHTGASFSVRAMHLVLIA
jgi:hypothetical protein